LPTIWAASCLHQPARPRYRHGIRLASDMVPNHMGIDSPWVIEHPEWFISRWDSPYPSYSFNGPDLSHDGRVEIKIEDHYYEQSDAAVVFGAATRPLGETRYIYHGNDGTSFPWNDTAQLDYLNAAVREQVIQTILHVARLFPVIRFDAAMTLAKRHFHRLWFPGPGSSGAIPFARRIRDDPGRVRPRHAARVLARGGRSRGRRGSRHAAAG
jgi:glycosidase